MTTGVPVKDPTKRTTSKKNSEGICPAAIGFKDQQPSAYSPMTELFYVPANHICMDYEGVEVKYTAGQPYVGAIVRMFPGPGGNRGRVHRLGSARRASIVWEIKENLAAYGGVLATAGDVVFYGTMEGWLKAVDQKTGKVLWKFKTPSGIIGNPMTYVGPGWQAVRRRSLGHRWLGRYRRGRGHRRRRSHRGPGRAWRVRRCGSVLHPGWCADGLRPVIRSKRPSGGLLPGGRTA